MSSKDMLEAFIGGALEKMPNTKQDIIEAMEMYAKEVAIDFSIWCQTERQYYVRPDEWSVLTHNNIDVYTSEQLFALFLQSK